MDDNKKTKAQLIAELEVLRKSERQFREIFQAAGTALRLWTGTVGS